MCCKELITLLETKNKEECFSNSTVAKEKGKEFRIEKSKEQSVCKVNIDACLITSEKTKKCDYFFRICDTKENLLIELKGKDVLHAVNQIITTFNILNLKLQQESGKYQGFIVSSSVPGAAEQRFRKAQEKSLKNHGIFIKKGHRQLTVKL